jgi:hypothetical protein
VPITRSIGSTSFYLGGILRASDQTQSHYGAELTAYSKHVELDFQRSTWEMSAKSA